MIFYPCKLKDTLITRSKIITEEGKFALDAIENNPNIEGSLADNIHVLSQHNDFVMSHYKTISPGYNHYVFDVIPGIIPTRPIPVLVKSGSSDVYNVVLLFTTQYGRLELNSSYKVFVFENKDRLYRYTYTITTPSSELENCTVSEQSGNVSGLYINTESVSSINNDTNGLISMDVISPQIGTNTPSFSQVMGMIAEFGKLSDLYSVYYKKII